MKFHTHLPGTPLLDRMSSNVRRVQHYPLDRVSAGLEASRRTHHGSSEAGRGEVVPELCPHHTAVAMRPGDFAPDDTRGGLDALAGVSATMTTHPSNLPRSTVDVSHAPIHTLETVLGDLTGCDISYFPS
jgi:hypothetical protein